VLTRLLVRFGHLHVLYGVTGGVPQRRQIFGCENKVSALELMRSALMCRWGCNALMGGATCSGGIRLDVDGLSSAHHGAEGVAAGELSLGGHSGLSNVAATPGVGRFGERTACCCGSCS
jgi:hypothetical protein